MSCNLSVTKFNFNLYSRQNKHHIGFRMLTLTTAPMLNSRIIALYKSKYSSIYYENKDGVHIFYGCFTLILHSIYAPKE